jgi:hypothetical protein
MDPRPESQTTPTTRRSSSGRTRGWVPATVAGVLTAGGLWALQLLSGIGPFPSLRDGYATGRDDVWSSLIGGKVMYFGPDNHVFLDDTAAVVRIVLMTLAVLLVVYVVTWLATVGVRARTVLPVLFAAWLGAVLGSAAGVVVDYLDAYVGSGQDQRVLAQLGQAIDLGGAYGVTYGWLPALVAALVWVAVPARRVRSVEPDEAELSDGDEDAQTVPGRSLMDDLRGDS